MLNNGSLSELSDEELVALLIKGQDLVLNEIMSRYKKPLFHFVTRYTHDEDTSYDMVQETFLRVYSKADTFNPSYKFKTWLYQIALNLCRDYARKKRLHAVFSLDSWGRNDDNDESEGLHDVIASDENIEVLAQHRQELKTLENQIDKLPHKLKTALILFAVEGYSQEECANILDITPKTVEMRVYRARKMLDQRS